MKNIKNRFFALLLSFAIFFSLVSPAFASNAEIDWEVDMRILAYDSGGLSDFIDTGGHAFLLFHNGCNVSVTIGHFKLAPDEYLTVGTFGNRTAHKGIWYNIEGFYWSDASNAPNASLFYSLAPSDLDSLNSAINTHDSWALIGDNCADFAASVWNSVVPSSLKVSGYNPALLRNSIESISGYDANYSTMPWNKSENEIARHTATSYVFDASGKYKDPLASFS